VRLKLPLVQVRGQWVALNPEEIEAAIAFWKKHAGKGAEGQMSAAEALAWGLGGSAGGEVDGLLVEAVQTSGWLDELVQRLQEGENLPAVPCPQGLEAQLRPYQQRGYSWLDAMQGWGLGACLADDMGLGKTLQTITLLLHARELDPRLPPALVVCPTSVAGNWQREIQRFAPSLRAMLHHGAERAGGQEFLSQARAHDVVITSYGLVRRDAELLAQIPWSALVVDEAQNIKNPSTRQTQAIRKLPAGFRLALTGTPVENRLSELWSILNFLNPGYLGSQEKFRKTYGLPIERYHDPDAAKRLKALVSPMILRRVKTDRSVIQDLPDKLEMKVYCPLTQEQASLYQAVVDDALGEVEKQEESGSKIGRRGAVLAALLRLKQVCNHPALYLADASTLPGRSGKLARLGEMLEEVLSVGEQALVFTQFASMGELLKSYLQECFGREALLLHGGTSRDQRERMVARFQSGSHAPPIFILSLKAGGVGLNLTAANHVFHFDRWWNPAVEDQATDRAFRIGQKKNVLVHTFICRGTVEEKIDELIRQKTDLARDLLEAGGETLLTEMSNAELLSTLTLDIERARAE
jgi:SNF2 family DNA or RNA helicase